MVKREFYTLADAAHVYSASRSSLYSLAARGAIDVRKAGRRSLVTAESLDRHFGNLPAADIRVPSLVKKTA